jgi:hypothetical protein
MTMLARTLLIIISCAVAACSGDQANADNAAETWPAFDQPDSNPVAAAKPATPLPRACDLVSAEQAQATLNQSANLMSDDAEVCVYASADNPGSITMLMVLVSDNEDIAMAQEVFNGITGMQGNLSALVNQQLDVKTRKSGQELDDLGDEAWLSASNTDLVGGQQLVVRKGTRLLTLNVTGMGSRDGLARRMQTLARDAVPRL